MMRDDFCATFPPDNTNGWMLWHYKTSDGPVDVLRPHYFDDVAGLVRDGDWIAVNIASSVSLGYHALLLIVQSVNDNGVYVTKLGFQPTAFPPQPALSDAELEAVIAREAARENR